MPKQKFKITAKIVEYRSVTVSAETERDAIEKASERLEKRGIETVGGFLVEPVKDLKL